MADAIQDYFTNPIMGDPSVFSSLGNGGWIVAMIAAAIAFRAVGAPWPVTALLGLSSLFVFHALFVGSFGLACFAVAAVLVERFNARTGLTPVSQVT